MQVVGNQQKGDDLEGLLLSPKQILDGTFEWRGKLDIGRVSRKLS